MKSPIGKNLKKSSDVVKMQHARAKSDIIVIVSSILLIVVLFIIQMFLWWKHY